MRIRLPDSNTLDGRALGENNALRCLRAGVDRVDTVVLGSQNAVKLAATRQAVMRVLPATIVITAVVESSAAAQPIGDEATASGAIDRACQALLTTEEPRYGIGLEGGIRQVPGGGWGVCTWAAVVDREGRLGLGGGPVVTLPASVADQVLAGEELGVVMDRLVGAIDTRSGPGAYGILTGGALDRTTAFEQALLIALTVLLRPASYR